MNLVSGPIPSWAVRGAKVVCVDDQRDHVAIESINDPSPGVGETCTIEATNVQGPWCYLWLIGYPECEFRIDCFRPAVEPKTEAEDLAEHFTPLLSKRPVNA